MQGTFKSIAALQEKLESCPFFFFYLHTHTHTHTQTSLPYPRVSFYLNSNEHNYSTQKSEPYYKLKFSPLFGINRNAFQTQENIQKENTCGLNLWICPMYLHLPLLPQKHALPLPLAPKIIWCCFAFASSLSCQGSTGSWSCRMRSSTSSISPDKGLVFF